MCHPGQFLRPSAWVLAGMLAAQCRRGLCKALLAGLALCSPCFPPWLFPALGVSLDLHAPHQPLASTVGEVAQLAWCHPTYWMKLLLKWQFKISHVGRGQRQRTNPSLPGNHCWAVQKTSLFTSRTPFASPSLSSPSKCHRFLSCSCSIDIPSPPEK